MRTVLLRSLGVVSIGAGLILACSSSSNDNPGTGADGGPGVIVDPGSDSGADSAPPPTPCTTNADCPSQICDVDAKLCLAPTCNDGVKNGAESDLDCGGPTCNKCDLAKACATGADCKDGVCSGGKCAAPTNTDGVKNGNETGVDCGGTGNDPCPDGQGCTTRDDCTSKYCKANVCTAVNPGDGVKNGTETDVDCGGIGNAPCADGKICIVDDDCNSSVCTGGICQVPTTGDGKKNGTETDVDCGGGTDKTCATGKACKAGADCTSGGCNYLKACAAGRSCTQHYGGDTCGLGGQGGQGAAQWEDCCTTADIQVTATAASVPEKTGVTHLDKYQVTAGRMRAFLEAIGYDVRGFVQSARAAGQIPNIPVGSAANQTHSLLEAEWDPYLPTSFAGNQDAGEIADCDQGYWDYFNKTCCETEGDEQKPAPTSQAACDGYYGAGNTVYVSKAQDGSSEGGACHYYQNGACPAGRTGIVPGMYTGIKKHLGGTIFRANSQTLSGCFPGAPGTHAFRFPDGVHDPVNSTDAEQSQEDYDMKSMNCSDYLVAQAFCVWDGGRLATSNEWKTAYYGNGTALTLTQHPEYDGTDKNPPMSGNMNAYDPPWWMPNGGAGTQLDPKNMVSGTFSGRRFPTATDVGLRALGKVCPPNTKNCPNGFPLFPDEGHTIEYANWEYSYEYPNLVANDFIVFINAPGRLKGRGQYGHADVIGNVFEIESTVTYNADSATEKSVFRSVHTWSGNGSWEVHDYSGGGGSTMLLNKYGKLGFRCAHK